MLSSFELPKAYLWLCSSTQSSSHDLPQLIILYRPSAATVLPVTSTQSWKIVHPISVPCQAALENFTFKPTFPWESASLRIWFKFRVTVRNRGARRDFTISYYTVQLIQFKNNFLNNIKITNLLVFQACYLRTSYLGILKLQKQERKSCLLFVFSPQSRLKTHSQYRGPPHLPNIEARGKRHPYLWRQRNTGRMWANRSCIHPHFGNLSSFLHPRIQVILSGSFFSTLTVKILKKESFTL